MTITFVCINPNCRHQWTSESPLPPLECPKCGEKFIRKQERFEMRGGFDMIRYKGKPGGGLIPGESYAFAVPVGSLELSSPCNCTKEKCPPKIQTAKEKYGYLYPGNPRAFCNACELVRQLDQNVESTPKQVALKGLRRRFG